MGSIPCFGSGEPSTALSYSCSFRCSPRGSSIGDAPDGETERLLSALPPAAREDPAHIKVDHSVCTKSRSNPILSSLSVANNFAEMKRGGAPSLALHDTPIQGSANCVKVIPTGQMWSK